MIRPDPREAALRQALRSERPDDEAGALDRALALAAEERARHPAHRLAPRRRVAGSLGFLGAAVAAVLVLSPAGAAVRDWIDDAVDGSTPAQRTTLAHLPADGSLLVESASGPWIVQEDGSRRRLGAYRQATFSPRGLYVGVSRGHQLTAVAPEGAVRWAVTRPGAVADPRWAPSGYRVAFREGNGLGIVAGDGTMPRRLVDAVRPVPPSWRPAPAGTDPRYEPNVLTYAQSRSLATVDVDTGRKLWRASTARPAISVEWAGPDRLIVATANGVRVLDRRGHLVSSPNLPPRTTVDSVAASPVGDRLAIVLRDGGSPLEAQSRLFLARIGGGEDRGHTVFSGFGSFGAPVFSPDGQWVLLPWEDTDQWLFISPSTDRKVLRRVIAVGDVARQFDPGGDGQARAPTPVSWCCG